MVLFYALVTIVLLTGCEVGVTGQLYTEYACVDDHVMIECPASKNISISKGDLGQYANCTDHCCPPSNADCTGDLETLYPLDMADLRAACDYQTSCSWRVLGGNLDDCTGLRTAEYLNVFFSCLPVDTTTPPPTTEAQTTETTTPTTTTTTTPPRPATTTTAGDSGGLSGGVIAGIVIGVLVFVACGILIAVIVWKKFHPPKPQKGKRRPPARNHMTTSFVNQGFTSEDQVKLQIDNSPQQNGVHNKYTSGPAPLSDGKRKSKPVSQAESFRYAKEKESSESKYPLAGKANPSEGQKGSRDKVPNNVSTKQMKGQNEPEYLNVISTDSQYQNVPSQRKKSTDSNKNETQEGIYENDS